MSGGNGAEREPTYRTARQLSAGVLIALVGLIVVRQDTPDIGLIGILLVAAAGMLAVDIPGLRR